MGTSARAESNAASSAPEAESPSMPARTVKPASRVLFPRETSKRTRSLDSVPSQAAHKIVMLHYPPVNGKQEKSALVALMEQHGVELCLYGHLHSYALQNAFEGMHWGIDFQLVSADYLGFSPKLIWKI